MIAHLRRGIGREAWLSLTLVGAVLTGGVLLCALVVSLGKDPTGDHAVPFVVLVASAAAALTFERAFGQLAFLSLFTLTTLVYLVLFAFVPLADIWFRNPEVLTGNWNAASWLVVAAFWAMYAGYKSAFALRATRRTPAAAPWPLAPARKLALAGMVIAGVSVFVSLGGVSGAVELVTRYAHRSQFIEVPPWALAASLLAAPAVMLQAASCLRAPTSGRVTALIFVWLPVAILLSGYVGNRYRAVAILVGLLGMYHFGYRRVRLPVIVLSMTLLTSAVIWFGINRDVTGTTTPRPSLAGNNFYYNYVGGGHDIRGFHDFSLDLGSVPSFIDRQYGKTFASVIPYVPVPTGGELHSKAFYAAEFSTGANFPPPLQGELYINFGVAGIILGMMLYGFAGGALETYHRRNRGRLGALTIYCYSLMAFPLILRGDFTSFGGTYLAGLVALAASVRWLEGRSGRARTAR